MKLLLPNIRTGRAHGSDRERSDDMLGRGMDIALTMLVFLVAGWALDAWLGLFPLITITLVVFAAIGSFVRMKFVYDETMERLEAERRATSRRTVKDAA